MFEWKAEYSRNIKEIDDQHKNLLKIGNKLHQMMKLKKHEDNYDEIMEILNELRDYTRYHFDCEEKLLEEHGYEDIFLHKFQHKFFLKKLEELELGDVDEDQISVTMELLVFVSDWIVEHILKTDGEYVEFLNSKGVY
ncbi:MAG: bacteriohemerythrin [Anaeromicrobium sp.]|jgi:hemerythrin|uniref:bacteriohemerythrin n=1 Tax=Anaeromicrobium sp. TaxID=1929132 RepID=UPI0025D5AA2D|nr:bacteriohemerythrin [Anaeromicrobium sp.]MCT4594645.1 bacteriohemerythrin [Anaeromicrobium sp.]